MLTGLLLLLLLLSLLLLLEGQFVLDRVMMRTIGMLLNTLDRISAILYKEDIYDFLCPVSILHKSMAGRYRPRPAVRL